jgi:SAM-dependent methyltransferase
MLLAGPLFYNLWSSFHFKPRFFAITEVIGNHQNPRILDLGCGTGLFKKYYPACVYVGIDNNQRYIDYAQEHRSGQFILGDILTLEKYVAPHAFDYVILNGVLHHLHGAQATHLMKTLGSFLNHTGRIIVVDHLYDTTLNQINKLLLRLDRGSFARTEIGYRELFNQYVLSSFKPFYIKAGPVIFWTQGLFVLATH